MFAPRLAQVKDAVDRLKAEGIACDIVGGGGTISPDEIAALEKHGIENIGYWVPLENPGNRLIYVLAHASRSGI